MSASPQRSVFRSEYDGHRVEVFADEVGLRVTCQAGDLLITSWPLLLLMQGLHGPHLRELGLYALGLDEAGWRVQNAFITACQGLPPGDPT